MKMKCPKCGSEKIRLVQSERKMSWAFALIFWAVYPFYFLVKVSVALIVLCYYDWWMYLVKKHQNKGYVWISKSMIKGRRNIYFCNTCHKSFKA